MAIFNMVGGKSEIITIKDRLCFTANTAWSTIKLTKTGSPTAVTLETSTDGKNWSTYTFWDTITLTNIWDKVYWRNTSETDTGFTTWYSAYYKFVMTWSIAWSWDTNYLLNKNSTNTLTNYCYLYLFNNCTALTAAPKLPSNILKDTCYRHMFQWCTWLVKAPALPATTLAQQCCNSMFYWCSNLTNLPALPAVTLALWCYYSMFYWCSKIKLSTSKTWDYQTTYRIPNSWTGTTASMSLNDMFTNTWWTFTWTPTINTAYYTSNTVV